MTHGRVLIVDDSLTVRMDLTEAFEAAGFTPVGCATVAQAREALAGETIDVAILDVQLPDGDGIELLQEVRRAPAAAHAMVLMLSTEAEVKDRIRGLRTGADDYVGKPYDAAQIVARARSFMRTRGGTEGPAQAATILIIDDSLTFRSELRDTMAEGGGYAVLEAETGEDGLRLAADHRPDAIIVDGMLPGIDGITVIRRLRDDLALRDIPCLLLTASEDAAEELRALEAGANAFVRKSDALDVILARLRAILRQAQPRSDTEMASLLAPRTVLVVDDSTDFGARATEGLREDGYEVVLAHSGEEALSLLAVQPVDCIVLDLVLPDMGGLALCSQIKAHTNTRDTPVLVMTDSDDPDAIVAGLGAGADDQVSKSGDFRFIRARIQAQLRRKQAGDEQRRIREQMLLRELEAAEARAIRDVAEVRAALADELAEKNEALASAKAQLEDYARTLEDRVRERSEQLAGVEQQLRHAQKMEAIGQLTGGIAHDFNNLLGIVTGNLDMLIEHLEGDGEGLELAEEALQGALRGATLTQRMLAFARKQPLQPDHCDINDALTAMAGLLRRTLAENIEISIVPAATLKPAYCDKHQVEDAILNFAINARDAMPEGGKLIIETANVSLDEHYAEANVDVIAGDYVMLAVSDTGSGMPADVIERAFDPFFTTKPTGKGTGLGLSMAYGFAKQSGGHIKIYSEEGHGTTIKLYLPQADEHGVRQASASAAQVRRSSGHETILIVEDDEGLRQVAVRMIADLGYATRAVHNPQEALALLATEKGIDLVFSDIVMPGGMTGITLAQEIHRRHPDIHVLLTTGYSETFVQNENGDLGRSGFLPKPYRKQDLAEKVRQMLDEGIGA